jgi:hypothetical protein
LSPDEVVAYVRRPEARIAHQDDQHSIGSAGRWWADLA